MQTSLFRNSYKLRLWFVLQKNNFFWFTIILTDESSQRDSDAKRA